MSEHPCLTRARIRAAKWGSTATTVRGVVLYLKSLPARQPIRVRMDGVKYLAAEKARQADPEAKRALRDPVFKRAYLFLLKRMNEQARRSRATTLEGITKRADGRPRRIAIVKEVARIRSIIKGKPVVPDEVPKITAGITIGGFDAGFARKHGVPNICMVGKDATLKTTRRTSYGHHCDAVPSTYHNGKWRGFERAEHDNYVRSFAIIDKSPRLLHYAFHKTEVDLELPEGFRWEVDQHGLKAAFGPDDFHVRAPHLLQKNAVEVIVRILHENAEKRAEMRARDTAEKAQMRGVWVCLADALRAGNCRAGCESFAARHRIDPSKHYEAQVLLDMANGDASRVRVAITAAIIRHKREMEQGYALLEEHNA